MCISGQVVIQAAARYVIDGERRRDSVQPPDADIRLAAQRCREALGCREVEAGSSTARVPEVEMVYHHDDNRVRESDVEHLGNRPEERREMAYALWSVKVETICSSRV